LTIGSFLGARAEAHGRLAVVDEQRLLARLVDRCRSVGVTLAEHTRVSAIRWTNGVVELDMPNLRVRARLVIDCTGGSSPIAATFRQHELTGFFTIYAEHRTRMVFEPRTIAAAHVSLLGNPPVFFELMPTGSDSAFCIAFTATRRVRPFDQLKTTVDEQIKQEWFVAATAGSQITRRVRGIIPVGRMQRRLPAIMSFGEAAMLQPPLLGTAFNEVLEHSHAVADQAIEAVLRNRTRKFRPRYPLAKRLNDSLQWWFAKRLIEASVEEIDYLIRISARLAPETLFALYSNELSPRQFANAAATMLAASLSEPRRIQL
jgi:flavin-dependent dehydrogenase